MSEDNDAFDTKGGKNTNDYVSLMSIREAETYFKESSERSASLTDGTGVWWWLRSPGFLQKNANYVSESGVTSFYGAAVDNLDFGVRPAMWINITAS